MQKSLTALAALATAAMLPYAAQTASAETAMPRYEVLPMHGTGVQYSPKSSKLVTWQGTFTYDNAKKTYTMVGTTPKKSKTTTFTIYAIPVKMVYGSQNGNMTFDPTVDQANGVSIVQNLLNSPLFNSLDWKWGSLDMGTTQYEDAFQRGSFWGDVGKKKGAKYHVVFAAPTVLSEVTMTVSAADGKVENNPFGAGVIGTQDINVFDTAVQGWIRSFTQVNPSTLPLFITDNIYLTEGGCCIGGYHSAEGNGQTYSYATYVTSAGAFSEDISAFSHELGEWYDDPLTNNNGYCGGLLEVGDPIEGLANYGTFTVTFGGVTWHPQALTFLSYFGAPLKDSANSWYDNQHYLTSVCQHGQ
jgi:hypothetical protein